MSGLQLAAVIVAPIFLAFIAGNYPFEGET
jgi:hypothetical protein